MRENNESAALEFYESLSGEQTQNLGLIELMVMYADWLGAASTEQLSEAFRKRVWAWNYKNKGKYPSPLIDAFITYWNAPTTSGKLRWTEQPKFLIGGRLSTFAKNQ